MKGTGKHRFKKRDEKIKKTKTKTKKENKIKSETRKRLFNKCLTLNKVKRIFQNV